MAKALVRALLICEAEDGRDVVNSLKEWYNGHRIGMDAHNIELIQVPTTEKKYKILGFVGVPADDAELYSKADAEEETGHLRRMQPENRYEIEEVE